MKRIVNRIPNHNLGLDVDMIALPKLINTTNNTTFTVNDEQTYFTLNESLCGRADQRQIITPSKLQGRGYIAKVQQVSITWFNSVRGHPDQRQVMLPSQ